MRMDENTNPEWKRLLRGTSSGRRALEIIDGLEAENKRLREDYRTLTLSFADVKAAELKGKIENMRLLRDLEAALCKLREQRDMERDGIAVREVE